MIIGLDMSEKGNNLKPISHLKSQIQDAYRKKLIYDYTFIPKPFGIPLKELQKGYNSYMAVHLIPTAPLELKNRLIDHIKNTYEDISIGWSYENNTFWLYYFDPDV